MGFCFIVISSKKGTLEKSSLSNVCVKYWKNLIFSVLLNKLAKVIGNQKTLKEKKFLDKAFSIFCKQLIPLMSFVFPKQVTNGHYSSETTKGHRLIRAQAVCASFSTVVNHLSIIKNPLANFRPLLNISV